MVKRTYKNKEEAQSVLKEAIWLAWNAAGGPLEMGVFQDAPQASKEDVWANATGLGDYVGHTSRQGRLNADYVFGRMLKLQLSYGNNFIEEPAHTPRLDYQAWCGKYKTYADLLDAAEKVLPSHPS